MIRTLIEDKTPRVLAKLDGEWQTYYIFFARAEFTEAARQEAFMASARTIDLVQLDQDLRNKEQA